MGIVLDIEKEANGIEHINKIPLLDVLLPSFFYI